MKKLLLLIFCLGTIIACSSGGDEGPTIPLDNPSEQPDNNEDDDPDVVNQAPSVPVLIFPEKDQLCLNSGLNFEWSAASDPENDQLSYNIQISTNRSFTEIIEDLTIDATNIELEMQRGEDYYWRVAAIDSENNRGEYSDANAFYVEGDALTNHIPFQPKLVSPDNGSTVSGTSVILVWEASDIDEDTLSFDLYFGTDEVPELFESNIDLSQIEVMVQPDRNYYWQIHVKDGISKSIGTIWRFTTN